MRSSGCTVSNVRGRADYRVSDGTIAGWTPHMIYVFLTTKVRRFPVLVERGPIRAAGRRVRCERRDCPRRSGGRMIGASDRLTVRLRQFIAACLLVLSPLALAGNASAQAVTGTIRGTVADTTGAVL